MKIIEELAKIMKEVGYSTTMGGGGRYHNFLNIYWRDLDEEEKKFEI